MGGKKKEAADPNYCPQCKRFILFDRRTGPTITTTNINMNDKGHIVCSCGFVVSDMSDFHREKPGLKGHPYYPRKNSDSR